MPNKLTRKQFLAGTAALASVPWLPSVSLAKARELNMVEVAPGLFVHQGAYELVSPANAGDISNMSLIIGKDAVAVVDTGGSATVGRGFLAAIRAVTDKPIRYVINTHMHPDHVFGNAPFVAEKATFVAHYKMARGLAARADNYLKNNRRLIGEEEFAGSEIILPTEHVKEPRDIDLGERIITLVPRPTAHTDNDLTIFDKSTGTLIAGDLLFSKHIPTLDGSIVGWLALIDVLRKEQAARVVPGHGPSSMSWPDSLDPLERYLRSIAEDVRAMIKENKTLTEATKTAGASEKDNWLLADEFHVRNVTAAFAELEWE
ncbi:MAG: quinoprotein relay system zinc metallohydrolase 2 [Hyphomicrobiaceae bacterium]|nr:quinoprotein relay system zinc metallohydrolase 2 [Hyphomicrobiaceae bacterium]